MYIIFDKNSNEVISQATEKPDTILNTQEIARCDNIPRYDKSLGDHLTVTNLQEKFETYTDEEVLREKITIDGQSSEIVKVVKVKKERPYLTCELVVNENHKVRKELRIKELKENLHKYDYISNKLSEATARYIITKDATEIKALYKEYEEELNQKQAWRDEINALEKEI